MKFLKYTLIVFVVWQFCEIVSIAPTKPKLGLSVAKLKGTHEILKDYPGYEPFWGLVFAEKDVAKNLYTFSTHQIKKEAAEIIKGADAQWDLFKTPVEDFLKDKHNTATQNLVRQMFHEVGGTFNVTNALNNPVMQFTPEHLGRILRLVHDAGADYAKMEADLKSYLLSLGLKDPKGKLFPGKDFNPFIKGLVGAVQECSSKNPDALFAPNTAQGIVLGYLLWKSNDRADLEKYFTGFLSKPVVLSDELYGFQEFADILQKKSDLQDLKQFADFVCAMIYQEKYAASFPKLSTSKVVTFKGISFSDCMDSTMLNVVNIATYDQPKARLGRAPEGLTMSSALTKFYSMHADPANIAHASVNQAWTDVVQNVVGVAYNRLADPETEHYLSAGSLCDGVIPLEVIDQTLQAKIVQVGSRDFVVYEKLVGDQNYWLVPQRSGLVCCELMPTASNIVVLMNHLFNLQLYPNIDVIFNPDFVKTYFANMCQKFGWRVGNDISKNIVIQVFGGKQFKIHLSHKAHGYIEINEAANVTNVARVRAQIAQLSPEKQAICIALGLKADYPNFLQDVFYMRLLEPNKRLEITKKCIELQNKKYAQIIDNLVLSFSVLQDTHYLYSLFKLYEKQPSKSFEIMSDMYVLRYKMISKELLNFYEKYFCDAAHKSRLLMFVQKGIGDQDRDVRYAAVQLLQTCVDKGVFDKEDKAILIDLIQKGIDDQDLDIQSDAVNLFKTCVDKDVLDKEDKAILIDGVRKWIGDQVRFGRHGAVNLLFSCIDKGVLDKEDKANLIDWIQKGIGDQFRFGRHGAAIYLFTTCVRKGVLDKGDKAILIDSVQKGIGDQSSDFRSSAVDLLSTCVRKAVLDKEDKANLIGWIQKVVGDHDRDVRWGVVSLLSACVRKGVLDKEDKAILIDWSQKVIGDQDQYVRGDAVDLLKLCVDKGVLDKDDEAFIKGHQPEGSMMAAATGKGMLSQMQMDNMRAGLPKDLQPAQPQQQQFTPPSADELAHQRQAIENFNQNQQAQLQQQIPGYQPQQLQLPVGQQVPAQQPGMLARWRANMKNALRGGARSVPR